MGQTGSGCLVSVPRNERRAFLASFLVDADGKLVHAAHYLGYNRSHIYRLIREYKLWPLVNRLRLERMERERQGAKHGIPVEHGLEVESGYPSDLEGSDPASDHSAQGKPDQGGERFRHRLFDAQAVGVLRPGVQESDPFSSQGKEGPLKAVHCVAWKDGRHTQWCATKFNRKPSRDAVHDETACRQVVHFRTDEAIRVPTCMECLRALARRPRVKASGAIPKPPPKKPGPKPRQRSRAVAA